MYKIGDDMESIMRHNRYMESYRADTIVSVGKGVIAILALIFVLLFAGWLDKTYTEYESSVQIRNSDVKSTILQDAR